VKRVTGNREVLGLIEIFIEILKFFKYLFIYIKNFRRWQLHILGMVMSVVTVIYVPKGGFLGCTTLDLLSLLLPINILISGALSAWVYSKAVSEEKKEETEVKSCYKNEIQFVDGSEGVEHRKEFDFRDTIEEGIEDFIPLKNGGFRRIYKIRRWLK
jgi:hypothetical protein